MAKKFLVVLLALCVVFAMAGCGDKDPVDPGGGGEEGGSGTWNLAALQALPGGITLGVGGTSAPTYDATTKVVSVTAGSSTMFYIDFTNVTGLPALSTGNSLKVTYACFIETPKGKVILKAGKDSWTDFSPAKYDEFTSGQSNTLTGIIATAEMDGLTFQHNVDSNDANAKYHVKILSVTKE